MVRVINKDSRLHGIGLGGLDVERVIRLWPGVNEVPDQEWAEAMNNKLVQHFVDSEVFEVSDALGPFAQLEERAAVKLIRQTYSRDLLKAWRAQDGRPGVLAAIAEQIDSIDPTKDPRVKQQAEA